MTVGTTLARKVIEAAREHQVVLFKKGEGNDTILRQCAADVSDSPESNSSIFLSKDSGYQLRKRPYPYLESLVRDYRGVELASLGLRKPLELVHGNGVELINLNGSYLNLSNFRSFNDVSMSTCGLQLTYVGIEDLNGMEGNSTEYLMTRLRSQSKYHSRLVASVDLEEYHCFNPVTDHYFDDQGDVIEERLGETLYVISVQGEYFANTDLFLLAVDACQLYSDVKGRTMTFTYIE